MKKYGSFFRVYFGLFSFIIILVISSIYFLSRTSIDVYSIFLSITSIMMVSGLFAIYTGYSFSYYFCLFLAGIYPTFVFVIWTLPLVQKYGLIISVVDMLAGIIVLPMHYYSYRKNLTNVNFYRYTLIMFLFYLFSTLLITSIPTLSPKITVDVIFLSGLLLFYVVSVFITNMAFRIKKLNNLYKTPTRLKKYEVYQQSLKTNLVYNQDDIALILSYFDQAVESFIISDYRETYLNAYKILFDEYQGNYIFDNIYKINNYKQQRKRFNSIRNCLVHSKLGKAGTTLKDELRKYNTNLYDLSLELLKILKLDYFDNIT